MTDIVLTETRVVRNLSGGSLLPLTLGRRRVVWRGPNGDPVFVLRDSRDVVTERIDVTVETPTEAVVVCERTKSGAGVIPSTNHGFSRWRIYGNGLAERGIFAVDTIDENNEHLRIDSCSFYGCRYGVVANGQQSKEHLITHCRFESGDVAVVAGSSFQMIGGCVAVHNVGVILTRAGDPVLIQGVGVEACGRLLVTSGPATDAQPITLIGVRFAADQLHEDGAMIVMRHAGPLLISGGSYGDGAQRPPHIQLAGIGEQAVTIISAKFGAFGADRSPIIRFNPGVRPSITVLGATYNRSASAPERTAVVQTLT